MVPVDVSQRAAAVRRFNRFYTRQIGVLDEAYLHSPFSVAQARVIYELAHREQATATELSRELALDPGYLSRMLRELKRRGVIDRQRSTTDGRQTLLRLTEKGGDAFALLNSHSQIEIEAMLNRLSTEEQQRVVEAMRTIEGLLGAAPEHAVPYILRPPQPGDMGWVINRHGVIYTEEYGWDEQLEAQAAAFVAKFIQHYDPKRERCWIAEKDGENVGSVFLVKKTNTVAKLRLFLVVPQARGHGIGTRLVNECVRFARQTGYKKIVLSTNSLLVAARHIYEQAGFRLTESEPVHSFGHDLIGETWELQVQSR